MIETAIKLKH